MFIINFYNVMSGIILFLPIYFLKFTKPDLFNKKLFHSFSININSIYNYSIVFSSLNLLFEITKYDIIKLFCHMSIFLIATEYLNILTKLNSHLNYYYSKTYTYNICIFLSLIYLNSYNSYIYVFHISLKLYEFVIFYLLFDLSYNEETLYNEGTFTKMSFENIELYNFYNINKIDIKYFSYNYISFYILNNIIIILTVNNPGVNLLVSMITSILLNYFNYTIFAHINIYYLLQKDIVHNDIIPPPSTPKFKII